MARRRLLITAATSVSALALAGAGLAGPSWAAAAGQGGACSAGAHTLSPPGAHVYPDTGNGGYTSVHTDVHLVYDTTANKFLPGDHVVCSNLTYGGTYRYFTKIQARYGVEFTFVDTAKDGAARGWISTV